VNKFYCKIGILALSLMIATPVVAAQRVLVSGLPEFLGDDVLVDDFLVLVQDSDSEAGVAISAREAANIALSAVPGAKVLKVKLLNSSVYAVTLRGDGTLTRVMVDANTGAIQ
jgi:Peptidase propeptide and YPEB domain